MVLSRDFGEFDWDDAEFVGWRDPKAPLRGYLVRWLDDRLVGVSLRAAQSRMSRQIAAMCLLCQSVHAGNDVSLFTARRSGRSGREANTIGTYMCADLSCVTHIRAALRPTRALPDPSVLIAERRASLGARLDAFVREVLSTEHA